MESTHYAELVTSIFGQRDAREARIKRVVSEVLALPADDRIAVVTALVEALGTKVVVHKEPPPAIAAPFRPAAILGSNFREKALLYLGRYVQIGSLTSEVADAIGQSRKGTDTTLRALVRDRRVERRDGRWFLKSKK